jgi:hypothetical protein
MKLLWPLKYDQKKFSFQHINIPTTNISATAHLTEEQLFLEEMKLDIKKIYEMLSRSLKTKHITRGKNRI